MDTNRLIVVAAGGTGGHLFPAEALATVLKARGNRVILATDGRVNEFTEGFPAEDIVVFSTASPSVNSLFRKAAAIFCIGRGVLEARAYFREKRPDVVVGFGGYPSVPPVFAAALLKIPSVIHEQNSVMGRANHMLARDAAVIATGFPNLNGVPRKARGLQVYTGNPLRPIVLEAAQKPFPPTDGSSPIKVLIFGGSQGARVFSDVVPEAFSSVAEDKRKRLVVVQQARPEDVERVRGHYKALYMQAEVEPFFKDLPARMADSHLVIARAGASTVSELAAVGRPSILVPLPGSLDQDQAANAESLSAIGAAKVIRQRDFTAPRLARELTDIVAQPETLAAQAENARRAGVPDAAEKLADAVMELIARQPPPAPPPA
ncbi:MAG: undecaprenyldiphospho-muramoylpentapeptide beta-N-acetylglucosaminyltransferase [Methylobacteriaceae bacterium]|jgi:UDP-N-acetylglucosamine--N-acetylmuramyl-(pentapeptide) pyrophosphoryl-undecaprenol N-acetylglucosamine transferase|nr:undecaprenyldiphospho-muramoylpentapeptide beta-N-acetylglucosaminyltransferase [Methylobacteriaceae bacterium]